MSRHLNRITAPSFELVNIAGLTVSSRSTRCNGENGLPSKKWLHVMSDNIKKTHEIRLTVCIDLRDSLSCAAIHPHTTGFPLISV